MVMKIKSVLILTLILFITSLYGCARRKYPETKPPELPSVPGIYHTVKRGQTLWNISKMYNVKLEQIVKANKIPDASKINAGQSIFIPYAEEEKIPKDSFSTFIWPVKGKVITHFGMKQNNVKSKGINIKTAPEAKVVAARSGKVSFVDDKVKGKGKTIIIDHGDNFVTVYAHNSKTLVSSGQTVTQGQVIAYTGTTGRVNIPQLYFEIRKQAVPQNPFYYLP
jgi:LysM repeat protein